MITEANIPNLMRCVRNNENASLFNLSVYRSTCGTYGCLVGNDAAALGISIHEMYGVLNLTHYEWGSRDYGISFGGHDVDASVWSFLFGFYRRNNRSKEACIRRLRKFIYYVLHKRELLYDDSGRVRETARRAEGNHNVLQAVKRRVDEECAGVHSEPLYRASIGAGVPDVEFPQTRGLYEN